MAGHTLASSFIFAGETLIFAGETLPLSIKNPASKIKLKLC
jgi:hypothetical protein